jgi:hypothetical protein
VLISTNIYRCSCDDERRFMKLKRPSSLQRFSALHRQGGLSTTVTACSIGAPQQKHRESRSCRASRSTSLLFSFFGLPASRESPSRRSRRFTLRPLTTTRLRTTASAPPGHRPYSAANPRSGAVSLPSRTSAGHGAVRHGRLVCRRVVRFPLRLREGDGLVDSKTLGAAVVAPTPCCSPGARPYPCKAAPIFIHGRRDPRTGYRIDHS